VFSSVRLSAWHLDAALIDLTKQHIARLIWQRCVSELLLHVLSTGAMAVEQQFQR
jgi:hypothetical protein